MKEKTKSLPASGRIHYAWFVCAGCALMLFCANGLAENAFTIYQPYIMKLNAFSNTQTSSIITFRTLASLISMLGAGFYYKKVSLRQGMFIAGLSSVFGFAIFSFAKSYAVYCIAAVFVGIGYGLGTMIPAAIVLRKWFVKSRNTAFGVCSAATGLSTFGIPSLISSSIEKYGLDKTFLVQSAVILFCVVISFLLIRSAPEDKGLTSYGESIIEEKQKNTGNSISKIEYMLLFSVVIIVGGVMVVAYCHLSVHITGVGYPASVAAVASSLSGISMMLGKIAYGRLGDRISNYKSNFIFGSFMIAGLVLNCFIPLGKWVVYLSSALFCFGIAFTSVGLTTWAVDLSPSDKCERNIRLFQTLSSLGALVFSPLPGIIADRDSGSYVWSYALFALLAVYVFAVVQHFYRKKQRTNVDSVKNM